MSDPKWIRWLRGYKGQKASSVDIMRWLMAQGKVSDIGVDKAGDPIVIFESGRAVVMRKLTQRVIRASNGQEFVTPPTGYADAEFIDRNGRVEMAADLQQTNREVLNDAGAIPYEPDGE